MTWVKLTDTFPEDPKIERLSHKAFRLHVTALCYCARNLTDGALTEKALKTVCASSGVRKPSISELVSAQLWTQNGDGFRINRYLDYNPSAEQVRTDRAKAKSRMQRVRSGERSGEQEDPVQANVRAKFGRSFGDPDPTRTKGSTATATPTVPVTPKTVGGDYEPEHPENQPPEAQLDYSGTLKTMPS